jgi:hypothetical protein
VLLPHSLFGWLFAPMFPVGLCYVFGLHGNPEAAGFWSAVPYLFYTGLTLAAFVIQKRAAFTAVAVVLSATLLLNIYGCYLAIREGLASMVL